MNRRGFLQKLAIGVAGLAVDPEKLLWMPTKTIFIPPPRSLLKSGAAIRATQEEMAYALFFGQNALITQQQFNGLYSVRLDDLGVLEWRP